MKSKVAALQFASGTQVEKNLETCLRVIDQAAVQGVDLMVLPEFCNHISWYEDADHAWRVSLDLDGKFLRAISGRAGQYGCYIILNVSLRHPDGSITVSSICYDREGRLAGVADKQALMGHENTWFARADKVSDVLPTPFGRIAMFPCRDGVTCETPRGLALRGAQLFCDSLNSFALDEASLHVPARAAENKVFVVAANKIGPLIPEDLLQAVSSQTHIPLRFLNGAGESQIISPRGEVLARASRDEEAVICAEIDLGEADDKSRPDGTNLFAARRPELYRPIADPIAEPICKQAADTVQVGLLLPVSTDADALGELPSLVAQLPTDTVLAVLPELFCYGKTGGLKTVPDAGLAEMAIAAMIQACAGRSLMLCTSLVLPVGAGFGLVSVLVDGAGEVARQPQLHRCERFPWAILGNELSLVDLPWGRLAMITGDDMVFPELAKVAALRGAHVLAAPVQLQENWEATLGLRSRSAENRVCVLASSRPLCRRAGLIADLESDFTLMTQWQQRQFDGYINAPVVTAQSSVPGVVYTSIHTQAACNKLMSEKTDLLLDRPWQLSSELLQASQENSHG